MGSELEFIRLRDKPGPVINRQPKCFADRLTICHGRNIKVHEHLNSSQLPFNFITSGSVRKSVDWLDITEQILENLLTRLIRRDEQQPEDT